MLSSSKTVTSVSTYATLGSERRSDRSQHDNEFTFAAFGICKISGSTGTNHFGNQYFATVVRVQDPAPTRSLMPSPSR